MTFDKVLPGLREGKKFRRKSWSRKDVYLDLVKNTYLFLNSNEKAIDTFNLTDDDVFADDWEYFDSIDKKLVTLKDMTYKQFKKYQEKRCQTSCSSCIFRSVECDAKLKYCWVYNKDIFNDKFLDQEVEVEE